MAVRNIPSLNLTLLKDNMTTPETQAPVDMAAEITFTEPKEMKFRFKKDKMGAQRPTVILKAVPVPNVNGLKKIIIDGGKPLELLLDSVFDVVRSAAAGIVGDNTEITEANFPYNEVSWEAIATKPRAERATISDEQWEAFSKSYLAAMPAATNKTAEQLGNHLIVYTKRFNLIKTNKPLLGVLKAQLGIYMEHAKDVEEHMEILEMLIGKADQLLKANDVEQVLANL